jgi:hypothetical protein
LLKGVHFKDTASDWWAGNRYSGAANSFGIGRTNSKDDVVVDASGNVGIGETTPDHRLDVAGNIGLDASAYINFGDTDGTGGYGIRDNAGAIECKNGAGAWVQCATASAYQVFTANGTWTKPSGVDANQTVIVEVWAGGGGGGANATGGGGGGGAYMIRHMRAGDLGATEAVTVGSGGAVNTVGDNSSFGTWITVYGGGAGANVANGGGGGGGGIKTAGASTTSGTGDSGGNADTLGSFYPSGGLGGTGGIATSYGGDSAYGGGGGGGYGTGTSFGGRSQYGGGGDSGNAPTGNSGGASVYGGGGGASPGTITAGGFSMFGGAGGNNGVAGSIPAGGGGRNAAGARGEVRVRVVP